MAAVVGSIGMLLIPIALIMFVIGFFKKSPNLKSKALKCFGLGLVLFIVGGIFHDSTPKDKNEAKLQATNQVTKQEVKQEPKQQVKEETQNIASQSVVEPDVKKKEATPITNEILEKYKENIAMQFKLKKDEYVDLLTNLKREKDIKQLFEKDEKIDIPNQPYALFQFYSVDNDWRFVKDPK